MTISPNGVVFVKNHVRRGIMPRMLEEILNTKVMVKHSMKLHKDDKVCVCVCLCVCLCACLCVSVCVFVCVRVHVCDILYLIVILMCIYFI